MSAGMLAVTLCGSPQPTPAAKDPLAVERVTLANGFTVFLSENHERPEVFGAVVVRTGGKNDPPDNTGMAHYLEHMLFKGTTKLGTTDWDAERPLQRRIEQLYDELGKATPEQAKRINQEIAATVKKTYAYAVPNEIDQLLEQLGGTGVNAFTSWDETVYHNTFPASQIAPWLAIYAHRFQDPVFRLFPTELEAVYEEKNIAIDTLGYQLFRRFLQGAFPNHGYSQDILGEVEHLKRPSLRAMKAYFDHYYVPANMALVLSGDFDAEEVVPLVREYFGAWKKRPRPKPPEARVEPFEPDQRLRVRLSPIRVGAVAFRTVPESHPDYAALLLARRLLSNEQRSGLIDRVSDEGKVFIAMYVPADFADHNLDVVGYVPRILTQSFRRAEKVVLEQFRKVREGRFDDRVFTALKEGLLAEETAKWEDNRERALAIAHAFVARGGWEGYLDYLERLRRVTKADVQRVANDLFAERRLILRSRMGFPKKQRLKKPKFPAVQPRRGAHSELFRQLQQQPSSAPKIKYVDVEGDVATVQLRDGVTLRANSNPFNDLYHLEVRFGAGTERIRELDVLDDYLERIGTTATPSKRFRQRLFEISTTFTATAEPESFTVRLHGPQQHMDAALQLLSELLESPKAERKPLRQVRREIWGYRRFNRKDVGQVGRALRDHVLYRDNSRTQREIGPRGARRLSARRLLRAWDEIQGYEVEVRYVGRQSPKSVAAALSQRITFRAQLQPAKSHVVYPRRLPARPTIYFVARRDAVQTHLWFAVEGGGVSRREIPAADAFSEYFGGSMAGLVFQEIREFRALAYSTRATFERQEDPGQSGHLLGYVGCQADKTFEALDVMVGLITDMPSRAERLTMVRSALVRSQETESPSFRQLQEAIEEWGWLGYKGDPRRWLLPAYEKLKFDDIARFYQAHVAGRPLAIMVVGDPRKVKPAKLKRYGKLVRVREGKLYSP